MMIYAFGIRPWLSMSDLPPDGKSKELHDAALHPHRDYKSIRERMEELQKEKEAVRNKPSEPV